MAINEIFQEDELVANMPEGHSYVSGQEPLIIDAEGVPYRRFELIDRGVVETLIEDEPINKFDLKEYEERNGSLNEDHCYDILELGYWCGDDQYVEPDAHFVEHMDSIRRGEGGLL